LCGLPVASSVTVTLPALGPDTVGEKVTLIVQLAFGASALGEIGQLLVCPKLALAAMLEIVRLAVPLFVSVTVCAGLVVVSGCAAKLRLVGDSVTAGATPVPLRGTCCGLPAASSLTETAAERAPVVVGEKLTPMVQFALAARAAEVARVCACNRKVRNMEIAAAGVGQRNVLGGARCSYPLVSEAEAGGG
jgi:hypothetical protein